MQLAVHDCNRPFLSCCKSHSEREAKCRVFIMRIGFVCICIKTNSHNKTFALKGVLSRQFCCFSRQNGGEIMTQNLCSKQGTLLQPQVEDIKRFSKGEQTSVFFWRYFPLTMAKLENVRITFSSCSPH